MKDRLSFDQINFTSFPQSPGTWFTTPKRERDCTKRIISASERTFKRKKSSLLKTAAITNQWMRIQVPEGIGSTTFLPRHSLRSSSEFGLKRTSILSLKINPSRRGISSAFGALLEVIHAQWHWCRGHTTARGNSELRDETHLVCSVRNASILKKLICKIAPPTRSKFAFPR